MINMREELKYLINFLTKMRDKEDLYNDKWFDYHNKLCNLIFKVKENEAT